MVIAFDHEKFEVYRIAVEAARDCSSGSSRC
jgi:hypothetical protein